MPASAPNNTEGRSRQGRLARIGESNASEDAEPIQSFRRLEPTEGGSKKSRLLDQLHRESRVLRREAERVRSRSAHLRAQIEAVFADNFRVSKRLAETINNLTPRATKLPGANRLSGDDRLRRSEASFLAAIEEERSRLARELHDDLNQQIAWLQLKVSSLEEPFFADSEWFAAERRLLVEGLRELSDKISRISRELHPAILRDLGLESAARAFLADFAEIEDIDARFRSKTLPTDIPASIGTCLYRILQEALRNVSKHANTKRVIVTLSGTAAGLQLVVRDYGIGMPSSMNGHRGLGLISMEERARLVNGAFAIRSRKGKGTQITVHVPLEIRRGANREPTAASLDNP